MIGTNITGTNVSPVALDLLYKMGLRGVRLWINGAAVIRGPGDYDLQATVDCVERIVNAGFWVYCNWSGVPPFMTAGKKVYGPFDCWVPWQPGDPEQRQGTPAELARPTGGWRFARPGEKPECHMPNIPDVDANEVEAFTFALGSALGDIVDWWGAGNEYDDPTFWPPISHPDYKGVGFRRAMEQIYIPSARGLRAAMPGGAVQLVGPETASAGALRMLCELEEEMGVRMWDVLSTHMYSPDGTYPDGAYVRADDSVAVWRDHGHGRPLWDTESDDMSTPSRWLGFLQEVDRRHGDEVLAHFRYSPWSYFEGGEPAYDRGQFVPNQEYRDMQAYLEGRPRRRAVRS